MKLKNLVLLALLFSTGFLYAQKDFRPGYAIKINGDTIFGQIDYRGDLLMSKRCRFKDKDNTIKDYLPNDIHAYRFTDSKYYVSRKINNKVVFLEYLIKGKVNIYYMRDAEGDHYYLDKEDMPIKEIPYEEGIRYVNDKEVFYESKKHIGILTYSLHDAPEFQSRIKSIKTPRHKNLIKLAKDYHNAVCDGEKCIVYDKKPSPLKISIEPVFGISKSFVKVKKNEKYDYFNKEVGGYVYLWLPKSSEKIYLKTGFLVSSTLKENNNFNYTKIPFQIQYMYRVNKFQPHVSGGFNFLIIEPGYTKRFESSVCLNAGFNYKITNRLFWSTGLNFEYIAYHELIPIEVKRVDIKTYTLFFGLRIDL